MAEYLYWIAFDCTGVPYKVAIRYILEQTSWVSTHCKTRLCVFCCSFSSCCRSNWYWCIFTGHLHMALSERMTADGLKNSSATGDI